MTEKFDEFSKHAASRRSRRSFFTLFGGSTLGAAFAAIFSRKADADGGASTLPYLNFWLPLFNGRIPTFNSTYPGFNFTLPIFNDNLPPKFKPPYFNYTFPGFNQTSSD